MKLSRFFVVAGLASALSLGTSCSSDDDDDAPDTPGETTAEVKKDFSQLSIPGFADDCAKYEITDGDCGYGSIELTECGMYLIERAGAGIYGGYSAKSKSLMSRRISAESRAGYGSYISGSYTKIADNTYRLDGFGTVTINVDGDKVLSVTITPLEGNPYTVGARKAQMYDATPETAALCRTWLFQTTTLKATYRGDVIVEESGSTSECRDVENRFYDALREYFPEEFEDYEGYDMADEVILTRNGSYILKFDDGSLDVRVWRWINRVKQILEYSYSIDWSEPDDIGETTVSFTGHEMTFYDKQEGYIGDSHLVLERWTTCTEKP